MYIVKFVEYGSIIKRPIPFWFICFSKLISTRFSIFHDVFSNSKIFKTSEPPSSSITDRLMNKKPALVEIMNSSSNGFYGFSCLSEHITSQSSWLKYLFENPPQQTRQFFAFFLFFGFFVHMRWDTGWDTLQHFIAY